MFVAGCAPAARPPQPELPRLSFSRVGILPADVALHRVTFQGDNPRLPEVESVVRARAAAVLGNELRGRGFTVRDPASLEASYSMFPDLRFQTTQVQSAFATLIEQVRAAFDEGRPFSAAGPLTLGPQASTVAGPIDAEALVLVRVIGYEKSGGQRAADFFRGAVFGALAAFTGARVTPERLAVVVVALLDGASGDVLWDTIGATFGDVESSPFDGLLRGMLRRFPLPPATGAPAAIAAASGG
jgi:hypothetical protein